MSRPPRAFSCVLALAATLPGAPAAQACGGCFSPASDTITTVDSHRMVIALSPTRTVLWDQILYSGDPEDFVWVLPVPSTEVTIDLAQPGFFEELDSATAPVVRPASPPPQTFCPSRDSGGCGDSGDGAFASDGGGYDGVTVHDRQTVGPYDTVTLTGDSGTALLDWLGGNGYQVPSSTLPTIQHYVDKHSAFVVLRLAPGEGVNAMQPVRVGYPGYMGTFPLKMVTVGAAGVLELALWVIAEQRYTAQNYPTLEISESELAWDWATQSSTYDQVFGQTIERAGGRGWIVEATGMLGAYVGSAGEDLAVATSIVPVPYVTRLRTRMLVEHMDQDLDLGPSAARTEVSPALLARLDLNRPADVECDDGDACVIGLGRRGSASLTALFLGVCALALQRARRRKHL